MNEKIILNERKSKIALILVLTILMQIFMPIFTGTSKVYAATNVEKANVICAQYSYMDADCDFNSQPTEIIDITLSDAQAFGNAVSCPTTYWVIVYAKDGDNIKWTSNGKTGEQTSKRVNSSIGAYYNLYAGDVYSFSVDPMKEVTFYISKGLKVVTSSVTLETNGGKINSGNITEYEEGTGATLPTDVTKDGHTFDGWYDNENLTGSAVTSIGTDTTGDKEYWAKWTPATYTVILNKNNGTINSGNVTSYTFGTETTLPTDVTRTDYTFAGWYDNKDLTGDKVTSISNTATGNKEYWASWTENPNIEGLTFAGFTGTYDANEHGITVEGDTTNYTIKYSTDGTNYDLTESPKYTNVGKNTVYYKVTRDGYKDKTGSVEINISEATITEDMFKFEDETVAYDGKEHTIKNLGSGLTNATTTFTVNKTNYTSLPKFTNAGTYTVYYKVTKANYNDLTGTAKVTINRKEISKDNATLEPVNKEMVVTGEEITQDVIVKLGDTIIPESEYTVTFENNKKIGTATIKVTDKDGGNYEVVDTLTTTFEIIDKGVIEVVTPNIPNANGAKFVGTAEELISKIEFTKEEQTAKENGKNIDLYLEVKDISNSVSESDKKAIEEKLENDTIGLYLDINLLKQVEGQDATKITETKEPITITFEIPEKLINTDSNIIRTYKILRLHEGRVDALDATVNGTTATFKTDEFSTYALAYTDKDITKTDTTETTSSPKTGDNIIVYAVMFIISTLGIAVISANNKKTKSSRR